MHTKVIYNQAFFKKKKKREFLMDLIYNSSAQS